MKGEVTREGASDFFWDFYWDTGVEEPPGARVASPWMILDGFGEPVLPTSSSKDSTHMEWTWTNVTLEVPDGGLGAQETLELHIDAGQAANEEVWGPSGFGFVKPQPDYSGLDLPAPINVDASNGTYPFLIRIDYDLPTNYPGYTCIAPRMATTPHVEDSDITIPYVCVLTGLPLGPRCYYITNSLAPPLPQWPQAEKAVAAECASAGTAGDVFFDERRYFWIEVVNGDVSLKSDPGDHGYFGGTPPTTVSSSTTSSSTTSSLPMTTTTNVAVVCGDADGNGLVLAADALETLRTAVGLGSCSVCACDADGNGSVTAADALLVLRDAVGQGSADSCPVCRR